MQKKLIKQKQKLNGANLPKNIISKIKGLNPFPGAWFKHKNNRIKIIQSKLK